MSQDLQAHDSITAKSIATDSQSADHISVCENCATPLQGKFCYQCGQSSHNPLRHFGHAIEEVFESFWHLDGRIFRTLRELWWPGRLANSYLAGHRAPYVAPLRLFVVLSVITFFLAQFVSFTGTDEAFNEGFNASVSKNSFADSDTAAKVIRDRDRSIQGLLNGKEAVKGIPGASVGFDRSISAMREEARERIKQLDPQNPELKIPLELTGPQTAEADARPPEVKVAGQTIKPTPEKIDPAVEAKKSFSQRWMEKKAKRAEENWGRFKNDPDLLKHTILSSIPTALFFMVPVFAMFLRLAYVETGRGYLEHLVVALYSHAWLCLAILTMCLLMALDNWITPHAGWFGVVIGILEFIVWWWMPIYLLIMQKRVYRQAWWLTVLKYCVIGTVYLMLIGFGAAFVAINSFISA